MGWGRMMLLGNVGQQLDIGDLGNAVEQMRADVAQKEQVDREQGEDIERLNSGNGPGGGASKLTGDVTQIIAQLPPVLESLTGVKFEKLLEQVPALRNAMSKTDEKKG